MKKHVIVKEVGNFGTMFTDDPTAVAVSEDDMKPTIDNTDELERVIKESMGEI